MSAPVDPKTRQSLENWKKALTQLAEAVSKGKMTLLEEAGTIQLFEVCYELAWKTLQKHGSQAGRSIASPREAFRYAFESGWIDDEATWVGMIQDRNLTVHTYDEATASRVIGLVRRNYEPALRGLADRFDG